MPGAMYAHDSGRPSLGPMWSPSFLQALRTPSGALRLVLEIPVRTASAKHATYLANLMGTRACCPMYTVLWSPSNPVPLQTYLHPLAPAGIVDQVPGGLEADPPCTWMYQVSSLSDIPPPRAHARIGVYLCVLPGVL